MSRLLDLVQRPPPKPEDESTESKEALLGWPPRHHDENHTIARDRRRDWTTIALSTTGMVLVAFCSSLATLWISSIFNKYSVNDAIRATSVYSPFFDATDDIRMMRTRMNGSVFAKGVLDTPWSHLTSDPNREPEWDRLDFDPIQVMPISREQVIRIGKDPDTLAKFDDAFWGFGDDAYIAGLDLHHQIHCLNKIRKAVLDGVTVDQGTHKFHMMHVRHCIDTMMQHLLCTADAGFITFNWFKGMDLPQPDFGVDRQCRDWEQIVQYGEDSWVDGDRYQRWVAFHKPEDRVELIPYNGTG